MICFEWTKDTLERRKVFVEGKDLQVRIGGVIRFSRRRTSQPSALLLRILA